MTPARVFSVALLGLTGATVEVEAAIGGGLPRTVLVGLPDTALYEARDRCKAAVASAGFAWPAQLVTINLTPATLPKGGSHYDLAIVAAVWAAAGDLPAAALARTVVFGELGLDGRVRRVRGLLAALLAARQRGFEAAVVPAAQVAEAALVEGLAVRGVDRLADLRELMLGRAPAVVATPPERSVDEPAPAKDLADVAGQPEARWALEVAAAGRHHLSLHGPPGVGKTMLAERLPGLLPELTPEQALEVAAVRSLIAPVALDRLDRRPPYADPHHSASVASVVGGGQRFARPGAVSAAHRGVLFLDEAPEFSPRVLESLRTPLESGEIVLGRADGEARYPARFQLVLAANPCPCGQHGVAGGSCTCLPMAVRRYRERLSGPIMDRIDIRQPMAPLRKSLLARAVASAEASGPVRERVAAARERQAARLAGTQWTTNGEVPGPYLRRILPLPERVDVLDEQVARGLLSARGVDRVIRIAWTVADLAGHDRPTLDDVRTGLAMRRGEPLGAAA